MTATGGRRLHGEDGVTLVELLTAMVVSSVVLAFVTGTVVNALKSQRRQTAQVAALNEAKLAFERVTRDIRSADPLRAAAMDRVTLDRRGADATVRTYTYQRVGDRLAATDVATGETRALVSGVAAGQPLFLFHLNDGSTVTGQEAVDPRSVQSITLQLRVEPAAAGRVVDLKNRVVVRNAVL